MTDTSSPSLTIRPDLSVFYGERSLGVATTGDNGSIELPLSVLGDFGLRNELTLVQNLADLDRANKEIWEWIDSEYPQAQSFCFEWYSEYDDEGGYYWIPTGVTLVDGDDEEIDTNYSFNDLLYEVGIEQSWFPDGEHKRPEA